MSLAQSTIFDAIASEELKRAGMQTAANNNSELLTFAREIAVELARHKGTISADDVQFELHRRGYSISALGNAAGSLFADKTKWQWTGGYVYSSRPHAHRNRLMTWRLKRA